MSQDARLLSSRFRQAAWPRHRAIDWPVTMHQPLTIISAMSRTGVIGLGDGMPWEVPEEYQHFLDTTRDQTLIIGRKSFDIFGPTLVSRRCFVISRSDVSRSSGINVGSLDEAIELGRQFPEAIYIAGGASIYGQAIDRVDSMQLSYIYGEFDGDSFFPSFDPSDWDIVKSEDRGRYEFVEYRRKPLG